ncbi:MAG: hypothetical protein OXS29_18105 [bacterium]|nr:hypothetical protein [bacterium]MDE0288179.1 hypothetical protein [bacterium]MDE0437662.1 hypothetical protein [bacterium]
MNPAQNLAISELLAIWSRRADRLHEVAVVTAEFREAAAAAVDDLGVPVRHLARVMDLSPRGMLRHVVAGREATAAGTVPEG